MTEELVEEFLNSRGISIPENKCEAEQMLEELSADDAAELIFIFEASGV